ncbi:DUF4270 domain-containing protein [Parabacteroides sp. OttesenSCG-928-O15]|nr:DUF4270 domain-containing protein [Parabacteroides sp. OttesenSCG-928-O15]
MNKKHFILGLCLAIFILGSCDDDLSKVGTSIQGEGDKISVSVDSFNIAASTVKMESVYAKSDTGLLGEFYDPLYGTLVSDYICQFYCPEGYRFEHTPIDGKVDSVDFRIYYSAWVGDSLAPMRVQLFPVTTPLEKNYYTDLNPDDYVNRKQVLGSQTYTAYDLSVPDSIRNSDEGYYPNIRIRMPESVGQKIYDETINNPSSFVDQDAFNDFFPGLYVTTTFGSGTIIGVDLSLMTIHYRYIGKGAQEQDTIIHATEVFNITKEVIQLNRFKNTDMSELLEPSDDYMYMKTPAGVGCRLIIPAKEIAPLIDGRILNNMPLTLRAFPPEDYLYALKMPSKLLLLPEDSVKTFFEKNKVNDGTTSFVASLNSEYRTYPFGNISNVLKTHIENSPGEDLVLMVFPITTKEETNYYGTYTTAITHYLAPSGLKLRKDNQVMRTGVTSSKYGNR